MNSHFGESQNQKYRNIIFIASLIFVLLISKLLLWYFPRPVDSNWLWLSAIPAGFLSWFFGWRKTHDVLRNILWFAIPLLSIQILLQAAVAFGIANI